MWMYDAASNEFWLGKLAGHQTDVPETTYYTQDGDEQYGGGFYRWSKKFKELTLEGPYKIEELRIDPTKKRRAFSQATYNWPEARIATLVKV